MFKAKSVKQESNQNIVSEGMYFNTNNNNHNNNNNTTTTTTVYFKITIWLFVHLYALKIEQCLSYFWSMYFLFWLGIFNLICL